MAAAFTVRVITIKRAYLEVEHAGVIVARHGKRSFVAEQLAATRQLAAGERVGRMKGSTMCLA